METPQNATPHTSKIQPWQLWVWILSTVGLIALAVFISSYTPTKDSFSKFTSGTPITAQNAASNWTGGSDNTYRARLTPNYVTQLDGLTTAILRKGVNMTDTQFKSYLTNLSTGITALGSRAPYRADADVQNILGFLVYEVNSTVAAMGSSSVGTSTAQTSNAQTNNTQTSATSALTPAELASQKVIHDQYFSLSSLKTEVKIANPALYSQVTSRSNYQLSEYFDALPKKQLSGFKWSLWCLGYGRTSTDVNEACSWLETSIDPNNTLPNSEYETRYILSPLPRGKRLVDGWKSVGINKEFTNQYDRAVQLNPNFDYSENTAQLKKFRVYLPKGTVSFSLSAGVPQWTRHAWAVKLGSPPETTRKPSNAEYLRNVTDRNIGNPNMTELRILRWEETIVTAAGGGFFGIEHERIGIYEKSIANAGLQYADEPAKQIWNNRDQYELKEGQWLYITELERDSDSYLDQMKALIIVKKPILDNEMSSLQFDTAWDPVFKGFVNLDKNDAFKGDSARSYITDAYFESLINPTSSDPKERCVGKIFRWISDASVNPNNSSDPDCQYQILTPELLRGSSGQ